MVVCNIKRMHEFSLVCKMRSHFQKQTMHLVIEADLCMKHGIPAFENVCRASHLHKIGTAIFSPSFQNPCGITPDEQKYLALYSWVHREYLINIKLIVPM